MRETKNSRIFQENRKGSKKLDAEPLMCNAREDFHARLLAVQITQDLLHLSNFVLHNIYNFLI